MLVAGSVRQLTAPLQSILPWESTTGLDGRVAASLRAGAAVAMAGSSSDGMVVNPVTGVGATPAAPAAPAS
jgi:hypothetical protein